jgi:SOS response regulatory protein OraA/RecX
MRELGYLDDRETGEAWLGQRLERRPEGRAALVAGLQKRGVSRETAEELVRQHVPDALELQNARRALQKLYPGGSSARLLQSAPERRRAARRLAARGFALPMIRRVLGSEAGSEEDLGGEGELDLDGA